MPQLREIQGGDGGYMITLLCGPSSVGKSTFYSLGLQHFLREEVSPPIIFAHQLETTADAPPGDCVVHYNMMRPLHTMPGEAEKPTPAMNRQWSYDRDLAWTNIKSLPGPKQAIILVTSPQALLDRVDIRRDNEPELISRDGSYNYAHWRQVYEHANLKAIYTTFIAELRKHNIAFRFVASRAGTFIEIDEPSAYGLLRRERASAYSADQIVELIKSPSFEYQRVELPFGLFTTGHDRRATCDVIFPTTLVGASVLDIGSALGAVCFDAERRGAVAVVGLEPRQSRFEASVVLKEILDSEVELRRETLTDFLRWKGVDVPRKTRFDYVLLLNVIHHLDNPITSLIQCAALTASRLIIEFPTLDDPVFAGMPPHLAAELNGLPLMGVSTRDADQTFLFTPSALERILLDHHKLFSKASFISSPMEGGRMIGIFEK